VLISICNLQFGGIAHYGKKYALLDLKTPPQDVVAFPRRLKAKFYNPEG
jgi:hypothetical protein